MTEFFFNHNDIYSLLYHGNINEAISTFTQKTARVSFTPANRNIYLSSLNFGIYNYILLHEKVSLHECCMKNELLIVHVTADSMLETGKNIIYSYGTENNYLIEKYQNQHIRNALYYIHHNLSEPLTLDIVSAAININSSYLCQLFKQEVKMNFCDYILSQRIKLANKLLCQSDYTIQAIAEKCGFKNAAYFSTCYKKYTSKKPSEFRNELI